ncbi:YceD family protein [Acidomonas methanolica]|uniref:YceD family protein n=1 Tax=Acidomonas methanolica TaxID=437 RepID=UPI00211AA1B5|nr:DUF177 domain-containing protein [Acidomonas methanolica]MCQ9154825.1 DUF177 domain-containing protein [Acidomonas methanolica]
MALIEAGHAEFSRRMPLSRLTRDGTTETVEAQPAECAALARRFGLPEIASLVCRYRLTAGEDGAVLAEGWLTARVTLDCVVTAEPFEDVISEAFTLRFVPQRRFREEAALEIEAVDEVPYEGREIDLGEATAEQFALALPPFPRAPGAFLDEAVDEAPRDESGETGESRPNPFAALAHLRGKES